MNPDSISKESKEMFYLRVAKRMCKWYGKERCASGMACLYWMHAGLVEFHQHMIEAVPAAGTARWEIQPDDGKMTHFGFEWNGDPNAELRRQVALTGGMTPLPEMHCWIWIPKTQEVVDFSAGYVPTLAREMGFEWKAELPPTYIWARVQSLFPRAIYFPNRDATKLAIQTLVVGHKGTKQ